MNSAPQVRVALITGASSGIGESFCNLLGSKAKEIVIVARREDRLIKLKNSIEAENNCKVHIIAMDLSNPDSAEKIHSYTIEKGLQIDTLINNAGYSLTGKFIEYPWESQQKMIQVMIITAGRLIRFYLPEMIARGEGRIMNVGSFSSFFPGSPYFTLYAGIKHYILIMSQSLAIETVETGVTVTALCPGPTETEWIDNSGSREFVNSLPKSMLMTSDEVARIGYKGMLKGKRCIIPGFWAKLSVWSAKLLPSAVFLKYLKQSFVE